MADFQAEPANRQIAEDVTRQIISDLAPEELDLFDELVQDYYTDPPPPITRSGGPLALGIDGELLSTTAAALAVLMPVLRFLWDVAMQTAQDEGANLIRERIKAYFKGKKEPQGPAPLTPEQQKEVRRIALAEAKKLNLGPEDAEKLANAILVRLTL